MLAFIGCLSAYAHGEGLDAARLGVVFNLNDAHSRQIAEFYASERQIPSKNLIGVRLPAISNLPPEQFEAIRKDIIGRLPGSVQSLLLVWSKPFAVGCMSITSAMAAGFRKDYCGRGCAKTPENPLFDTAGWLPADTIGWWPAMLLPSDEIELAKEVIRRAKGATAQPAATLYLNKTADAMRNVRAATYDSADRVLRSRIKIVRLEAQPGVRLPDAMGYFTGAIRVEELPGIDLMPGALADHLTSAGGVLDGRAQMPVLDWLRRGAAASYGSVSEPCNFLEKFPNVSVLFNHYLHGETALESYWKSVQMVGQGLIVGDPLSRPFAGSSP